MKVFISTSGGKEASLSCYKAMREGGIEVSYLLNMVSADGTHSCSHGIRSGLLRAQAEAMGIPIVQKNTTRDTYEKEFKSAVAEFKKEGITAGVFGDIDVQEHRDWVERVCGESGVKAILPLWKKKREELLEEFVNAGFKALVVALKRDALSPDWLGREIDRNFIADLKKLGTVDLCGEAGEYHTFVYDGPTFVNPVEISTGEKKLKDKSWFLEIKLKEEPA